MSGPAADRFARIDSLLDAALDRPLDGRAAFLETACEDPALRQEVHALLHAIEASAGFLDALHAAGVGHAGDEIGAWRLVRPLGRGGTGEVWLARREDGRFEQQVAVKLLHHDGGDHARLLDEQRLLARLQHPGIARLLDAGNLADGRPYMVMEYVDGLPLLRHCLTHSLAVDARLALFLRACDAVAFAHRHLVVHGDLKHENILVRADGGVALLDFGIARLLDHPPRGGEPEIVHLTPAYAAPEQLRGAPPSTQTDVHALGVLLHELLAGQSPWGHLAPSAPLALLQRAHAGAAQAPSTQAPSATLARRLRGDLDAIVGKATQEAPVLRYVSVEALADDVRRHLAHEPVRARRAGAGYRLQRLLRRHWFATGAALLLFACMAAALAAISLARRDALRERDAAQVEARRSKAVRDYLAHMFRDAGQHSQGGAALSAQHVLARAAARIDAGFADAPATNAEVLKALGELHFYIDDYAGAEPLLRRWLAREAAIADDVAAADVRFTLAETVHRMGRPAEAKALLASAQAFWQRDPQRHADVLLTSRALEARLLREGGDAAAALDTLERARDERLQRSGRVHFETAALYTNLGAAYGESGRLDEGIAASREAMALWQLLGLDDGNDALNTLNNLAAMQFRKGDLVEAEAAFSQALALRRALLGPSAATAALLGNLARVLQRQQRHDAALEYAGEAEAMASAHAGESSPLAQAARVTHAELLLALDRADEAAEVLDAFATHDPSPLPGSLRLRAAFADADRHRRLGDASSSRTRIADAESLMDAMGAEAEPFRARLDALRR
jgi:non-specific serine/threonine protein kinase/serine/threonine-protein kinase